MECGVTDVLIRFLANADAFESSPFEFAIVGYELFSQFFVEEFLIVQDLLEILFRVVIKLQIRRLIPWLESQQIPLLSIYRDCPRRTCRGVLFFGLKSF